ncbi:MAG: group II intron reverse transcriptase/maturase [Gammaproteobacteria bacterium]|nr:group II intron reverse transcriptase/maturase [Gammaproteobacteria bacterium]
MEQDLKPKPEERYRTANGLLTFNGCFIARELGEPSENGKLETEQLTGAPFDEALHWVLIDWKMVESSVRRLQVRIAKAVKENRWGKVKTLQYLLTNSYHAKLMAVKRVTSNKGKDTPGVDGVIWQDAGAERQAVYSLRRRGYRPMPLRRIYIPKKNGRKRPLSIPTMMDRAQQALYKLALAPVAETLADGNSYGFREGRSCADAVQAGFNALSKPNSAKWILEADIKGCFDNISIEWMLKNIPMDKVILHKWLTAGFVEDGITYPSRKGTPQGGIISPTLSNMALDGLEEVVHRAVPRRSRVNFIRYADDFIITAKSKRLLTEKVKPAVEKFLAKRGLTLSEEKTVITHIRDGFTFLGQTFRKCGRKLYIKPAAVGIKSLTEKVGTLIRKYVGAPMVILIKKLNQVLRGWADYHRHVVASEAFSQIDTYVFRQLWRMLRKRHPRKSATWLFNEYRNNAERKHIFSVKAMTKKGLERVYQVVRISSIGIKRHIKIKAAANPYDPEFAFYFWTRRNVKDSKLLAALSAREYRAQFT